MRGDEILVQLDTPARAIGDLEVAVDDFRVVAARLLDVSVGEVVEVLEHLGVPQGAHQLQAGAGRDDTPDIVKRHHYRMSLRCRGNLLRLQKAAALRHVRLDHMCCLQRPQRLEILRAVESLTSGDRNTGVGLHLLQRRQVVRPRRLLDPRGVVDLDRPRHLHRLVRRKATVHLDIELNVRSDGLAHRPDQLDRLAELLPAELEVAAAEGVELHPPVAALDHAPSRLRKFTGRALHGVPAVGVSFDAIVNLAADQAVDRLSAGFADGVPAGHLHHGQSRHHHLARPAEIEQGQPSVQGFDVVDLVTDNVAAHVPEVFEHRVGAADDARLPVADDAGVGLDDKIGDIAPGSAQGQGAEIGDLQTLFSCWFHVKVQVV